MLIEINPLLWSLDTKPIPGTVKIDDDRTLAWGETLEVDDDEFEELRKRRYSQRGSRHQTLVVAGSRTAKPEKLYVSVAELSSLSVPELRDVASSHDLGRSGNKTELIERISAALSEGP